MQLAMQPRGAQRPLWLGVQPPSTCQPLQELVAARPASAAAMLLGLLVRHQE